MGRKNKRVPDTIVITAAEQFERDKPRFNPYQGGNGAHCNKKAYCRRQKHQGRGWE